MPRSLSDLFGRYSLPNVMGRLGHRIGGLFHHGDTPDFNPGPISQTGGLTQTGYTPGQFGISDPFVNPQVGGDAGGGQMSDPFGGGFLGGYGPNSPGSTGGITPRQTYGGGMYTSGTLGGGTALDPSQWGAIFNNDAGNSVPYHTQYGGAGESGHGNGRQLLPKWQALAAQHHMGTGGNGQSYDSSGINPGGGALPGTGGPAQVHPMQRLFGGNKQPPGGLIR